MRKKRRLCCSLLFTIITATACGGGGGSDTGNSNSSPPEPPPPDPPTPVNPTLAISDAEVAEGDSGTSMLQFRVDVSATATAGTPVASASVEYATASGDAVAGVDFEAASGTIEIPSGTTEVLIEIAVLGDTETENDESFSVTLSSPTNATIVRGTGTGTIRDDDLAAPVGGLDTRPENKTCIAPARPTGDTFVSIIDPYPLLPDLQQPTKIVLEPGGSGRWFVLQKRGQIVTFSTANPDTVSEYIDLRVGRPIRSSSEGGLLGLAFHPDYPSTPEIFLSYTIQHSNPNMRHVLSRMVLDDVVKPGAGTVEQVIMEIDQDFDNHNGGDIAFGPDGYLYFGLGDGGSGNDPLQRAQDTTRLLGSMLRIDVVGTGSDYGVPADNPFAPNARCGPGDNLQDCPEIYAWGFRNPWRWSFDAATGGLWLADVGQGSWEEVNRVELGGNYGWRCREGAHDTVHASDCSGGGLVDPVTEYGHRLGNSITGGFVYRGSDIPELEGLYIFADYGSGRFWAARPDGEGGYTNDELIDSDLNPTAFALGPDDELYFVDIDGRTGFGRVRRLDRPDAMTPDTIPDRLSQTGCVDPDDITRPYAGLLPYEINAPFWSDGAIKDRYIGLPDGQFITISESGDFQFPNGTVIVKNFRLGGDLVETRHLMRHPDGVWAGYTYEWNSSQTEATRVRGGKVKRIDSQDWIYPSQGQCMECHTRAADFALGAEIAQLNRDFRYPATGRTASQLETIEHVMMFASSLPGAVESLDRLASPADSDAPLEDRARAYLHTNCAQCHRPNGPTPSAMDLRYATSLGDTNACGVVPLAGDLGIPDARLIAPGNASASLLVVRMQRRDSHGMPPTGSSIIDAEGVALLSSWIDGLGGCEQDTVLAIGRP